MFSPLKMAIAVDRTQNAKLGLMATTYAAKSTCPDSCPFKDTAACYGMVGPPSAVWKRLSNGTHTEVAKDEADVIAKLTGTVPLRLHTMGDCSTNKAAQILAKAAQEYTAKQGQKVYTYTHTWRRIDRKSWGSISVLASCETVEEAMQAMGRGYPAAMTVMSHEGLPKGSKEIRFVSCLKQTHKAETCLACGLCLRAESLLRARTAVCFAAHGPTTKAKKVLDKLNA